VPIGSLVAGFVVEGAGVLTAIVAMGATYVGIVALMFLNPVLRGMDTGSKDIAPETAANGG
jgi:hypothetical protein